MNEPLPYSRLPDRGIIAIDGPDARPFLQGLVTNDVAKVGESRAQWNALLTPQGRLLFDFFVVEIDGALLIEMDRPRLPALLKKLTMYRLRAKVDLTDRSGDFATLVFPGETALSILSLDAQPGAGRPWYGGVLFSDPRLTALGARAILPVNAAAAATRESGAVETDSDTYTRLRLSLGVPEGPDDLPPEKALPMESGFDELHGLSWSKGCYMGQELTARMNYRALVKKRLLPIDIDGPPPSPGTAITQDGKEVGEVRSAHGRSGLAHLRLEALESDAVLIAGEAQLVACKPDWLRLPRKDA